MTTGTPNEKAARRSALRRARYKAKQKCSRCGAVNRSKFDLCVSCRAEMSRVEVERQDNLRANGLCVRCRKPRNLFSQLCDSCGALAWDNAGKNKLLQAKKEEIIAEYARLVKSRLSVVESKKTLAERYGCSVATIHKYVTKTGQ